MRKRISVFLFAFRLAWTLYGATLKVAWRANTVQSIKVREEYLLELVLVLVELACQTFHLKYQLNRYDGRTIVWFPNRSQLRIENCWEEVAS